MVTLVDHYAGMARYNRWMNDKLYDVAGALSDEERKRPLGAFFGSVHGTLNHILLADRVWLARFGVGTAPAVRALSDELYADYAELRRERAATDAAIEAYAQSLTPEAIDGELTYTRRDGVACRHPLWQALSHFFNHQTHHRGQVTTLFMQLGRDPGVTDLIALLRS